MHLSIVDWLIMLVYFVFVLGIGFALKRYMRTSNDFFLAGSLISRSGFAGSPSSRPTWAPRKLSAWGPRVRSTASDQSVLIGSALSQRWSLSESS